VHVQQTIFAGVLAASLTSPLAAAPDETVLLGPRAVGETISYRLNLARSGTKEPGHIETIIALSATSQGLRVTSTDPAEDGPGVREADGAVRVANALRAVIDPYNQVQTGFSGRDGHGGSSVHVVLGAQDVYVPVETTSADSGGSTLLRFEGHSDTTIRGITVHVTVDIQATVVDGRFTSASARNEIRASVLFRKIRVEQVWSLTRLSWALSASSRSSA
jgi:hypothetical protein